MLPGRAHSRMRHVQAAAGASSTMRAGGGVLPGRPYSRRGTGEAGGGEGAGSWKRFGSVAIGISPFGTGWKCSFS